jgi:hypothetical protein
MASGLLGFNDLTAATNTTVYTVPANTTSSFSVNFTNRSNAVAVIRLAICTTSTPANSEYIFLDYSLAGGTSLERTGLVAQAAKLIVAYSSTSGVSVQVYGYEA